MSCLCVQVFRGRLEFGGLFDLSSLVLTIFGVLLEAIKIELTYCKGGLLRLRKTNSEDGRSTNLCEGLTSVTVPQFKAAL